MTQCLVVICKEFEKIESFLNEQTIEKENKVNKLFINFMSCFKDLKEEKLEYPKEFVNDVRLFHEGFHPILEKFQDVQMQYLMLSDFYDFARITKKYSKSS